nr:RNA-directed DNA polymerase, eukaryota [Tanacetum cinerariifolium]GEY67218.1 RNA-directed DNA polymerase, eukaryota [Tanacetum cinerariifolium]
MACSLLHTDDEVEALVQKLIDEDMAKTLSIGGRLTLLKSVIDASPLYNMSIYKVPRGVMKSMEAIRSKFFNGADYSDKKIAWAAWDKVLASKKNGGLALYGPSIDSHPVNLASNWCSIVRKLNLLKDKGFDFLSHRKKRIGDQMEKEVSVAVKMGASVVDSFRRAVRDETEHHQMLGPNSMLESVSLSSAQDRWICDLSGDGEFRVKEVRNILDDLFLPAQLNSTRWVKYIPIKINVFTWRARRDCLPTRSNLIRQGVPLQTKLLKERDILLGWGGAVTSTEEYMKKVIEDVGDDEDFKSGSWVSFTDHVHATGGIVTGLTVKDFSGTIPETLHQKVIGDGDYEKDITVGTAMILVNVSVFTPKSSKHYLNITIRNVVKVFCKDTVHENDFG